MMSMRTALTAAVVSLVVMGVALLPGCGGGGGPLGAAGVLPSTAFTQLMSQAQRSATFVGTQTCGTCHGPQAQPAAARGRGRQLEDILDEWKETKHGQQGIGCEKCHGPGSVHVADVRANGQPTEGDILFFPQISNAVVCGQCHSQAAGFGLRQFDEWSQAKHAEIVTEPEKPLELAVQFNLSLCMNCHSNWFRAEVTEAWGEGELPNGTLPAGRTLAQYGETASAQNGFEGTSSTASCIVCHDAMGKTGNTTYYNGRDVQVRHPVFSTDTSKLDPNLGIFPPAGGQFVFVDHACAECHNGWNASGSDDRLNAGTSRPNFHENPAFHMLNGIAGVENGGPPPLQRFTAHRDAPGQCSHCHMYHSPDRSTVGHSFTVKMEACAPCHTPTDAAARKLQTQSDIEIRLVALLTRMQTWATGVFGDKDAWDYTALYNEEHEITTFPYDEGLVPIEVRRARHNFYFVIRDRSRGVHNALYARFLLDIANTNLDNIEVPRSLPSLPAAVARQLVSQFTAEDRVRSARSYWTDPLG